MNINENDLVYEGTMDGVRRGPPCISWQS